MGWQEFVGWLKVMKRQNDAQQTPHDSWAGADNDPWWQQARRERDELQAR